MTLIERIKDWIKNHRHPHSTELPHDTDSDMTTMDETIIDDQRTSAADVTGEMQNQ